MKTFKVLKPALILFTPSFSRDIPKSYTIPYAMLYMESVIRCMDIEIILIDEHHEPDYSLRIENLKGCLLLAAVTCNTGPQIEQAVCFSKHIRAQFPETRIVWGGWHASLMTAQTLNEDYVDYVISGQGEIPFRKLVAKLFEKEDLSIEDGVSYKRAGKAFIASKVVSDQPETPPDLNYSLIDIRKYIFKFTDYKRTINYFSSRGCPYSCSFCAVAPVYRKHWMPVPVQTVISDLKYFKQEADIDSVFFWDENFFLKKERTLALCKEMIAENLNVKWDAWVHAAHFIKHYSHEDIELMCRAGMRRLYAGAESGNDEVLASLGKNQQREDLFHFLKLLKPHPVIPMFSMILGFPMQPRKDISDSLNLLRVAKLLHNKLMAIFSYYTPYPGTGLYKVALEKGFTEPADTQAWTAHEFGRPRMLWMHGIALKKVEYFDKFYLMFANPAFYKWLPFPLNIIVAPFNVILYPFLYLRFRFNFFWFPAGAVFFILILQWVNRISGKRFKTGNNRDELN